MVLVTLTLAFSPAEEAKLRAKAEASGVSVESLVHDAALDLVSEPGSAPRHPVSAGEMKQALEELTARLPKNLPSIPHEALRRENMYADEWNRE